MDTMFSRGVVSLKPATNIFSKRQLLSFFAAAAAVVVVVGGTLLRNDDALALLRSGARDIQMENCGLHDAAATIAETLLDQTTEALKQLNLRRNGISGE